MGWTPFEETIKALQKSFTTRAKKEYVNLMEAHGRILASDIKAEDNSPKAPTSDMDGYAIRFEDQELEELKIISYVPAGTDTSLHVNKQECIKTFTGSLMSEGSDTLIPIENVEVRDNAIIIQEKVPKGFAVRPMGEAYKKGDVLIHKGTKIGYAQIATLAEQGVVQVGVFVRPKVAILATGDEIVDIGEPLTRASQIRSSNHVAVASIVKEVGGEAILLGIAQDDKELIKQRILDGLSVADMVVTTGGVSVGDYDFVKDVVAEVGLESVVHGSAIKPGRHVRVVKVGEKYILALPGFPYSSMVGFYLYGVRVLEYWLCRDYERRFFEATLDETYEKRSRFTEFTACNLTCKGGGLHVNLEGKVKGSSAIVINLLSSAHLLCVPIDTKSIQKGEKVTILKLGACS